MKINIQTKYMNLKIVYAALLFVYSQIVNSVYDEKMAKRAVSLAQASYCDDATDPTYIVDTIIENHGSKALLGYDNYSDTVFAAFRGSSNTHNWMEDIQISQIAPYENETIKIEKGFYKNYDYLKPELFENIESIVARYKTDKLMITGHSLGSAAATLFAYDLYANPSYEIAHFYIFGSPRVGNGEFADDFNKHVEGYRVVHNNDIVPCVPPKSFDYAHISLGICYNENNSEYIVCDQDDKCQIGKCSVDDHLNYLNVTMGSSGCI